MGSWYFFISERYASCSPAIAAAMSRESSARESSLRWLRASPCCGGDLDGLRFGETGFALVIEDWIEVMVSLKESRQKIVEVQEWDAGARW